MTDNLQEYICLTEQLAALMQAHDIPFHIEKDWVAPYGNLPALNAIWYPQENNGLLEIKVLLEDGEVMVEGFLGVGEGEQAIGDAMRNFCANSFHVMLAAFWGLHDPEQVSIEQWQIHGHTYLVFNGGLGIRNLNSKDCHIPPDLHKNIATAIQHTALGKDFHWFRLFFSNVGRDDDFIFEALHNDEAWETGLSAIRSCAWQAKDNYYSVRNFLILKKI